MSGIPLLSVRGLGKEFRERGFGSGRSVVRAVDDVSFDIHQGETLGLVGESGSGKTTIGRMIVRLEEPTSGRIELRGEDLRDLSGRRLMEFRRDVQMIFQNTQNAFNPRRSIRSVLSDPYEIHRLAAGRELEERIGELMRRVGLTPEMLDRYPQQFSGGQRQRIGIARALALQPSLVIADEPVSGLDVSVQAQVLNLFAGLRRELGLAMLFISHDLRAVYFLCERIAVMYLGRLVEIGPRRRLLENPVHPYTRALVGSIPAFQPGGGFTRTVIQGEISDSEPTATGCHFAPRCALWRELGRPERCREARPPLSPAPGGGMAACHFADVPGSQAAEFGDAAPGAHSAVGPVNLAARLPGGSG
ncbi:ABC transporter ATP-binding protein [Rhizohabitans arisaemae]|uniref:ABC transporter ATP-binding protein n=1 Tax=Rhizohabitans arisaemae TaxID=2720610 RepID=UPI0024B04BB3|nr:oligopeptide/dipeptide ABC transporter ATP-binding protein [Rhizohabitans arisaemae]